MPVAVGMNMGESALAALPAPAVSVTGLPTGVPPLAQPEALVSGPHAEKLTVPVGLSAALLPVTTTWSLSPAVKVVVAVAGEEATSGVAWLTVKHSSAEPSVDTSYVLSPE